MLRLSLLALMVSSLLLACGHQRPKSTKCFDEIRNMVKGKTAEQVEQMLGQPDSRQRMTLSAERWIWWNYTYLDGNNYPPEVRGRVVHLEVIFEPARSFKTEQTPTEEQTPSELIAADPLSVSYTVPEKTM